jgi:hypothetical protein
MAPDETSDARKGWVGLREARRVTDQRPDPASVRRAAGRRALPIHLVVPAALGLASGSAIYFSYLWWTHREVAHQAVVAAAGDPDLDRPTADECAMARAVASAAHATGDDKRWEAAAGATTMSLGAHSKIINPADVAGFTDDEADNLRGKSAADWRWCAGISTFVTGLGWSQMGIDYGVAELGLGRAAVDKPGDEARMYEAFIAPKGDSGMLMLTQGPWVVSLRKGPSGAWQVTSRDQLKKYW